MPALDLEVSVGVVGAGTMGAGIAQVAAAAGHPVILFDAFEGAAAKGLARIKTDFGKLVANGKMEASTAERTLSRISVAETMDEMKGAGLVIEAILEDLEVKRKLFADLEAIVSPEAILASNTSSISITSIARDLSSPERFVGMHFFNPAPVMKLVEVISGVATSPEVASAVAATATNWKKVAVKAKSTPGFIVNRVARPYYAEALRLLEEGVGDIATLDALMTEGAGFRMGPFALMDLIGHDVNYAVSKSVFDAYYQDPRFRPSILQLELVNAGRLGRKSGRGFYNYSSDADKPSVTDDVVLGEGSGAPEAVRPGEVGEIEGVALVPTDGRRAAALSQEMGRPVIVFDVFEPGASRRLAYSMSRGVPTSARAAFVAAMLKQGVRTTYIPDWPGLIVARTLAMLANEGFEAVMQGVADEAGVDTAMKFGVNYPKGPIAWAREVGLTRLMSVLDNLVELTGDPRYRASLGFRIAAGS